MTPDQITQAAKLLAERDQMRAMLDWLASEQISRDVAAEQTRTRLAEIEAELSSLGIAIELASR